MVDNIGKSFRGRPVVKGVSLRLGRGEVAGLLGPNGAGKTTCFYMITGLIPADYGAIYLDGENITAQPMYQRARMGVGYLHLRWPWRCVLQLRTYCSSFQNQPPAAARRGLDRLDHRWGWRASSTTADPPLTRDVVGSTG